MWLDEKSNRSNVAELRFSIAPVLGRRLVALVCLAKLETHNLVEDSTSAKFRVTLKTL